MWEIYDQLIESVPEKLTVLDCMVGLHWTLVRSELGLGAAMTVKGGQGGQEFADLVGMPLRELASWIKSWNMIEASMGQAAMNAAFNLMKNMENLTGRPFIKTDNPEQANGFAQFLPYIEGKKVAVIGHFPHIDSLSGICQLSILERIPQENDYPDPACEYILPQQDVVFITGTAFINKTMPRLLEISKQARIVLIGPSVPISPVLFKFGVDTIASTILLDETLCWKTVRQGGKMNIFKNGGQMVCIQR
ncbi:MAG: DUF364 domain-containing protein [Syntrophomonadaceae bacterium]|nr:DUF364 domain-containing protein [Syntrophomonadaceae bacterium]